MTGGSGNNAPTQRQYWDHEHHIVDIDKNEHEVIRVMYVARGNSEFVSLREWWTSPRDPTDTVLKPGRNGITINLETGEELLDAIQKAMDYVAPTQRKS